MSDSRIRRFEDVSWHVPVSKREDIDWDHAPADDEAGRKFLIDGEGGFYLQAVRIPPSFEAPLHHHDHAEIFLVIEGDCSFNGESMNARDCTVVEAGQDYSFKAGPQGVTFLVTRQGAASYQEA
jgi:mannose-6-phosphate isomerase-like protein (cupin superfamily)